MKEQLLKLQLLAAQQQQLQLQQQLQTVIVSEGVQVNRVADSDINTNIIMGVGAQATDIHMNRNMMMGSGVQMPLPAMQQQQPFMMVGMGVGAQATDMHMNRNMMTVPTNLSSSNNEAVDTVPNYAPPPPPVRR